MIISSFLLNFSVKRHREAAKSRRDQETVELNSLAKLLPVPEETVEKLDKGTILRLVISYLKLKQEYEHQSKFFIQLASVE